MVDLSQHTRKFQKEMNAGISSLILLSVLSQSETPLYGYQIAKMLEENSSQAPMMKQGTLYPVLRSLEENELLASMVEPSVSGPPRRYYQITPAGRAALAEWVKIWQQTKIFVDSNLRDLK